MNSFLIYPPFRHVAGRPRVILGTLVAMMALGACDDASSDKATDDAPTVSAKADGDDWLTLSAALGFGDALAVAGSFETNDAYFGHTIEVFGPATVSVEVTHKGTASRLDTYMWVFGPMDASGNWTGAALASDDDSGYALHSKIAALTLREAGRYQVVVTTWDGKGRGKYRIAANCEGTGCAPAQVTAGCHPAIADAIRACHADRISDGELDEGTMTTDELMRTCADAEVVAAAWDTVCVAGPGRPAICGADLDDFSNHHLVSCRAELVSELLGQQCVFGARYRDMFSRPGPVVVQWRRTLTAADSNTLSSIESAQLIRAVRETAYDDVATVAEAFAAVDEGIVNQTAIWDASTRRSFIAYEVGAGDNSFGAWFPATGTEPVALNRDGDVYDCTATWGPERRLCDADEPCADGLSCNGRAGGAGPGRCLDTTAAATPGDGDGCTTDSQCQAGLVCAGASMGGGLCNPAWMRGFFFSEPNATIADAPAPATTTSVHVFGLATVSTDVFVDLFVTHPRISDLRITLTNPDGTEGVVFEGNGAGTEIYVRHQAVQGFPGDESVNGTWTLHVTDTLAGSTGEIRSFGIELTSRWD